MQVILLGLLLSCSALKFNAPDVELENDEKSNRPPRTLSTVARIKYFAAASTNCNTHANTDLQYTVEREGIRAGSVVNNGKCYRLEAWSSLAGTGVQNLEHLTAGSLLGFAAHTWIRWDCGCGAPYTPVQCADGFAAADVTQRAFRTETACNTNAINTAQVENWFDASVPATALTALWFDGATYQCTRDPYSKARAEDTGVFGAGADEEGGCTIDRGGAGVANCGTAGILLDQHVQTPDCLSRAVAAANTLAGGVNAGDIFPTHINCQAGIPSVREFNFKPPVCGTLLADR